MSDHGMSLWEQGGGQCEDVNPHRVIRASAGAGKTYQLTIRYLLLLRSGAKPEEILATTFTKKAAGEILGRILARLAKALIDDGERKSLSEDLQGEGFYEALRKPMEKDECLELLKRLIASIHRLSVSTLDSFFQRVSTSFRYELGLPVKPMVLDERSTTAKQMRMRAINAMLTDAMSDDVGMNTLLRLMKELHHETATRSVAEAIGEIVEGMYAIYQEVPEWEKWSTIEVVGELSKEELDRTIQRLVDMESDLPVNKNGKVNSNWRKDWEKSINALNSGDWEAFTRCGIVKKILADELVYSRHEIKGSWLFIYEELLGHVRSQVVKNLKLQTESTWQMLSQYDKYYTKMREQMGVMSFSDVTMKLAKYLPRQSVEVLNEIYFRLDGQIKHLLLDEFQDTSRAQWSVIEPIAVEVSAHAEGWAERSLFCVGDTKQAIYGWRGGCAELFDQVEALPGIDRETSMVRLDQSYRSSQVVLDAVNDLFSKIEGNELLDDYPIARRRMAEMFGEHKAARQLSGHVQLVTSIDAAARDEVENGLEGDWDDEAQTHELYVGQLIKDLVKKYSGKSIGVLVNKNATVDRLLFELMQLGVMASGEGGSEISDEPAVAAVLAAMKLADHPGDHIAAFHVFNTPIAKVVGLEHASMKAVEKFSVDLREELLNKGYAAVLMKWVKQLASVCDERSLVRLQQLVEIAEEYEQNAMGGAGGEGLLRPSYFVEHAKTVRKEDAKKANVRVMTVHQSKGLEFDIVVLGELDREFRSVWPAIVDRDSASGDVVAVYRSGNKEARQCYEPLLNAYSQVAEKQMEEELCKLYVAMTRAKHALYMVIKAAGKNKNGTVAKRRKSFASLLINGLCEVEEQPNGGRVLYERGSRNWMGKRKNKSEVAEDYEKLKLYKEDPQACVFDDIEKLFEKEVKEEKRMWGAVSPSSMEGEGKLSAAEVLRVSKKSQGGLRYGELIHTWFSLIGFWGEESAVGMWDDVESFRVNDAETLTQDLLCSIGEEVIEGMGEDEMMGVADRFKEMLGKAEINEVLLRREGGRDDKLWRERNFAVSYKGSKMMRGAFDRVVVHRSGEKVLGATLIDWKTDRFEDDQALAEKVEVYRPQIEAYKDALMKMLGVKRESIVGKLVFVSKGVVREL